MSTTTHQPEISTQLYLEWLSSQAPRGGRRNASDRAHDRIERMQSALMDVYRNSAFHDNCACHHSPSRTACRETFIKLLHDAGSMTQFYEWLDAYAVDRAYRFLSGM